MKILIKLDWIDLVAVAVVVVVTLLLLLDKLAVCLINNKYDAVDKEVAVFCCPGQLCAENKARY